MRFPLLTLLLLLHQSRSFYWLPAAPGLLLERFRDRSPFRVPLRVAASSPRLPEDDPTSPLPTLPPGLQNFRRLLSSLPTDDESKAQSLYLISLGDQYAAATARSIASRGGRRVPGCVSVVHMTVRFSSDGSAVHVNGISDARLSYGLVALVSQGLSGESPETILSLEPSTLPKALGLTGGMMQLAPGRHNGLANIVQTVQDEVLARLHESRVPGFQGETGAREAIWAAPAERPMHTTAGTNEFAVPVAVDPSHAAPAPATSFPVPAQLPLLTHSFPCEEVAVLLSGGVDSSVALHLLQQQGYKPHAFYLKIWLEDELAHLNQCPWEEDWSFASAVCRQAGNVPLEALPLQKEYWAQVVAHTIQEAKEGRTPNPDILCNSLVKFGVFYDVMGRRYPKVATGHYARAVPEAGGKEGEGLVRLMRSPDRIKDQTYFLSRLTQEQLARATFPIGGYEKHQIRAMAERLDLPTKTRKDSQGICFLGKLRFDDFLRHYLGESPGEVVWLEEDVVVGKHQGLWFHTIGQRKGIVPTLTNAYRPLGPWYVAAKDVGRNVLFVTNSPESLSVVGTGEGPGEEARRTFRVDGMTWIRGAPPPELLVPGASLMLEVQVRHGPNSHRGSRVRILDDGRGEGPSSLEITLPREDSLAPGQYAALYQNVGEEGSECLGAGVISEETWRIPQAPARLTVNRR